MADSPANGVAPETAMEPAEAPAPEAEPRARPDRDMDRVSFRDRIWTAFRGNWLSLVVLLPLGLGGAYFAYQSFEGEVMWGPRSRLGQGSEVVADPREPMTERYRETVAAGDAANRAEATREGESHIDAVYTGGSAELPIAGPVGTRVEPPSAPRVEEPQPDPITTRRYPEQREVQPAVVRSEVVRDEPIALGAVLEELVSAWDQAPKVAVVEFELPEASDSVEAAGMEVAAFSGGDPQVGEKAVVPAGRILYAATLVGVDSELGLPVVVEVLEAPLRGAVLRGEFQQVRGRMLIRFNRMTDAARGIETGVEAYAVGLDCECGAVEGEVDRHWFSRVVVPAAFGFAGSYLDAAAQPEVTVAVDGQVITQRSEDETRRRVAAGLAGAVRQAGEVIGESLPRRTTVRLLRGQDLGVVFVEPVLEKKSSTR